MPRKLNITAVRNQLLSFPERLAPGESIEVVRHRKTVLKILRPPSGESLEGKDPFDVFDQNLMKLRKSRKTPPRSLAARYKSYLYGKKTPRS